MQMLKDALKHRFSSGYISEHLDNNMIEFRDPVTSRAVELQKDWKDWFVPGQSIIMSLIRSEPL